MIDSLLNRRIVGWASTLPLSVRDALGTAWRDAAFPGRSDLRDEAEWSLFEADKGAPLAGSSDFGRALSDLSLVGCLRASSPTQCERFRRLVDPVADVVFGGDRELVLRLLDGGWPVGQETAAA